MFEYQCEVCGLKFEKTRRNSPESLPCPSCGKSAGQIPSAPSSTWTVDHEIGSMPTANIGVSTVDHSIDRIAGQRAEQMWAGIEDNQVVKREIIHQHPGASGKDLSRLPEGGYRIMQPKERHNKDSFRKAHNEKLAELARQRTRQANT